MTPVHVGDVGVVIRLTVYEDGVVKNLSSALTRQIKIRKPNGTVLTRTAEFVTTGIDGRLQCLSLAEDFDAPGLYEARASFYIGGWQGHTTATVIECVSVT
jgi:hypothetical protein